MKHIINIIALCTLILFTACDYEAEKEAIPAKSVINVKTLVLEQEQIKEEKTFFGMLSFSKSTSFKAQQSGIITQLNVNPGQFVNKGDVLVVYPPINHQLRINEVKIEQEKLVEDYQRQNELFKVGAVSKVSVQNQKAQLDLSNNRIQQLQRVNTIVAPFNGVITQTNVNLGDEVELGKTLFSLSETNRVKVDFYVTSQDIQSFEVGAKVSALIHDKKVSGRISKKAMQFDEKRKAFLVTATFEDKQITFTGNTVELIVETKSNQSVINVPSKAVKSLGKQHYVYVVEKDTAKLKKVRIGKQTEKFIQILKGLKAEDILIVEGSEKLDDNNPISIVK
jgi:RND family efflux transporter MFP subunit